MDFLDHELDRPQRKATPDAHIYAASSEGNDALVIEEDLENSAILCGMGLEGCVQLEFGAVEGGNSSL